ncbi:two-component system response regulator [Clostridium sp. chh4-2]|uniref:response regulator n=1 Tax=Clostridium sp. chh4-2 TaxID=2067550 RepID=UPI000CCE44C1|nr:response regulator [Clostridium sp. chh4-2]PNV59666.1 two-component system response regulator [Clostridium sp. chh4-2]PNV61792.1 two-component system response regulator [Clostridium sp. chh4-2]
MEEKILIVDDAAFIRLLIKNTLKRAGFSRFLEAEKGKEALELYKKEKPDLVILDITMGGMSGLEVLEALINIDHQARVIMCSSVGKEEIVQKALNLGAWSFLVKPFNPETLSQLVQNAFT